MPYEFKTVRRIEFSDTDMAGIVHFANFFRFMESTEHAFYRSLGFSVSGEIDGVHYGWPRIRAECDFRHAFRLDDEIEIQLFVRERKAKTVAYDFIFRNLTVDPKKVAARGSISVICITRETPGGPMRAVDIPHEVASKIEVAPADLLAAL